MISPDVQDPHHRGGDRRRDLLRPEVPPVASKRIQRNFDPRRAGVPATDDPRPAEDLTQRATKHPGEVSPCTRTDPFQTEPSPKQPQFIRELPGDGASLLMLLEMGSVYKQRSGLAVRFQIHAPDERVAE